MKVLKVYFTLLISLLAISIVFVTYLLINYDEKILLGAVGITITFYFGVTKVQIENDRFFKELFRDFNERYSELNKPLYDIAGSIKTKEMLSFEEKDTIYDYFNLCAEEYYWFKKNRISNDVWKSWKSGMDFWYEKPIIKNMWEDELKNSKSRLSYYLKPNENFFTD